MYTYCRRRNRMWSTQSATLSNKTEKCFDIQFDSKLFIMYYYNSYNIIIVYNIYNFNFKCRYSLIFNCYRLFQMFNVLFHSYRYIDIFHSVIDIYFCIFIFERNVTMFKINCSERLLVRNCFFHSYEKTDYKIEYIF